VLELNLNRVNKPVQIVVPQSSKGLRPQNLDHLFSDNVIKKMRESQIKLNVKAAKSRASEESSFIIAANFTKEPGYRFEKIVNHYANSAVSRRLSRRMSVYDRASSLSVQDIRK
jgi:hypothetical protein